MIKRIILTIIGIFIFYVDYLLITDIDVWSIIGIVILTCFQIYASIYIYKDYIGWNNFVNSEGFNLKRKK